MIASAKRPQSNGSPPAWHADFLAMLPAITENARFSLRDWRSEVKQDLVQEVVAHCFVAYQRLVERGKPCLAFPTALVGFALRQILTGRRIGGRLKVNDVMSRHAQRTHGVAVERLDHFDNQAGEWKEALVEDRRAGPAETAAARIDFGLWLQSLSNRNRRIAEMLASGEKTGVVARRFGLTAGRISQLRTLFERSWQRLQDGPNGHEPRYADAA